MPAGSRSSLSRRRFLRLTAASATAAAAVGIQGLISCGEPPSGPDTDPDGRSPLAIPVNLSVAGASLTAAAGTAAIADGVSTNAWLFNGSLPGPTLRARQGDRARLRLLNQLPESTIVHWHGLLVPANADGHPRDAIGPGASFDYDFPLVQRAGTFWYHPHAHQRTADQIHRGLTGFFIVGDAEEDALQLPSGAQEILLLLQDRAAESALAYAYAPTDADLHSGMLRGVPFGNGVRRPTLSVSGARYRFRVVNASHARVYRLGLDSGAPLTVIGNDGGLLPSAAQVPDLYLGVGERSDFLIDFGAVPAGTRLMLKSLPFGVASSPSGNYPQGMEMDLLELVRGEGAGTGGPALPAALCRVPLLDTPAVERTFVFSGTDQPAMHRINGLSFDMNRVDIQVPLGQVERWVFRNDSAHPHPVHVHGAHFQVVSRAGGRGTVFPYEAGWKDTVLVMPLESVEVLIRFSTYRGLFLLHCHNLQHEDLGMMLNVEVV
jgi:FtsP/CotA-like multicopper oxidase with cupredoxin domain